MRVYFIADGVNIPFSVYAYKYLCRYRPIGSRIFTFLIGRFCEKIPYFMKNSYKQLVNV